MFAQTPQPTTPNGLAKPAQTSSMRVLLLDDSEFDRRRVRRLLQNLDFDVQLDEAESTQGLQTLLDAHKYDVALLDYRLQVGDGADAVALLRHHRVNATCPTIMIASDVKLDPGGQVMHDKCDGFLAKSELSQGSLQAALISTVQVVSDSHPEAENSGDAAREPTSPAVIGAAFEPMASTDPGNGAPDDQLIRTALGDLELIIRDLHKLRHLRSDTPPERGADLALIEQRAIVQWRALRTALAAGSDIGRLLDLAPNAPSR